MLIWPFCLGCFFEILINQISHYNIDENNFQEIYPKSAPEENWDRSAPVGNVTRYLFHLNTVDGQTPRELDWTPKVYEYFQRNAQLMLSNAAAFPFNQLETEVLIPFAAGSSNETEKPISMQDFFYSNATKLRGYCRKCEVDEDHIFSFR